MGSSLSMRKRVPAAARPALEKTDLECEFAGGAFPAPRGYTGGPSGPILHPAPPHPLFKEAPMAALFDLWLPILVSAVFVFLASSVIHMALPIHKSDYGRMPEEEQTLSDLRSRGLKPGAYAFPFAGSMKAMGEPEFLEKLNQGPVGFMNVLPNGPMDMGRSLTHWFLYSLVISVFSGYVGTLALGEAPTFLEAFRVTGTVAVLAYAAAPVPDSIWKGVSWGITFKFILDGVVYGLVTALAFGWLW